MFVLTSSQTALTYVFIVQNRCNADAPNPIAPFFAYLAYQHEHALKHLRGVFPYYAVSSRCSRIGRGPVEPRYPLLVIVCCAPGFAPSSRSSEVCTRSCLVTYCDRYLYTDTLFLRVVFSRVDVNMG